MLLGMQQPQCKAWRIICISYIHGHTGSVAPFMLYHIWYTAVCWRHAWQHCAHDPLHYQYSGVYATWSNQFHQMLPPFEVRSVDEMLDKLVKHYIPSNRRKLPGVGSSYSKLRIHLQTHLTSSKLPPNVD